MRAPESVCNPELDECLARHANPLGFSVDRAQQVYREVDIHSLDIPPRPLGLVPVKMLVDLVRARIEEFVKPLSGNRVRSTTGGARIPVSRALARAGPR